MPCQIKGGYSNNDSTTTTIDSNTHIPSHFKSVNWRKNNSDVMLEVAIVPSLDDECTHCHVVKLVPLLLIMRYIGVWGAGPDVQ